MSKHKGKNKRAGSVCPVMKPRANSKHEKLRNHAIYEINKYHRERIK